MKNLKQQQKMKKLKAIIDAHKQKAQFERDAAIKSGFNVVERNGFLWLTHCGVAFAKVPTDSDASDITKTLNEARDTAVEFERL